MRKQLTYKGAPWDGSQEMKHRINERLETCSTETCTIIDESVVTLQIDPEISCVVLDITYADDCLCSVLSEHDLRELAAMFIRAADALSEQEA